MRAIFILGVLATAPAGAQSFSSPGEPYPLYPTGDSPVMLTPRENEAVILSEGWQDRYSPAMLGRFGRVIYHYGEASAPVITAPNNVTHIALQRGETLVEDAIFIGDSVNWRIIPVLQGVGDDSVTHIVVKPAYANLETTMIAITDRRSYYFHLKSIEDRFMASVGFEYPEIEAEHWAKYQTDVAREKQAEQDKVKIQPVPDIQQDITDLDFDYVISGDSPSWKPVRVYNDGRQVFIQMPKSMQQSDAPAFVELGEGNAEQIVNYRLRRGTFIIDKLFTRGMLITGTGRGQRKVVITYVEPDND